MPRRLYTSFGHGVSAGGGDGEDSDSRRNRSTFSTSETWLRPIRRFQGHHARSPRCAAPLPLLRPRSPRGSAHDRDGVRHPLVLLASGPQVLCRADKDGEASARRLLERRDEVGDGLGPLGVVRARGGEGRAGLVEGLSGARPRRRPRTRGGRTRRGSWRRRSRRVHVPYLALKKKNAAGSDEPILFNLSEKKAIGGGIDQEGNRSGCALKNDNCWTTPQSWVLVRDAASPSTYLLDPHNPDRRRIELPHLPEENLSTREFLVESQQEFYMVSLLSHYDMDIVYRFHVHKMDLST
ncbi:hypothetical protein PR202_ga08632 [Eleusine coracana subsp. coracana]|uniref:Uncharacterized protein n=1 Tax=Eleusine coracana subsp. coracana TaxID=191504 RepID=A0AAV5C1T9_ELECO|nr:hypothetical protein PR202_ga08632 [Eleusine coracana subsp. coracana]